MTSPHVGESWNACELDWQLTTDALTCTPDDMATRWTSGSLTGAILTAAVLIICDCAACEKSPRGTD